MDDQTSRVGCECVIAGGEWEPCREHDLELAVMTSGSVSTEDMFIRSRLQWHVTDSRMVATMPGTAPVKSSRTVALKVSEVTWDAAWHASHRCVEDVQTVSGWKRRECRELGQLDVFTPDVFSEYVERAREVRRVATEARKTAIGQPNRPTTTAARKAPRVRRPRTASEMATARVSEPVAMDLDRMARLTAALAVTGDTWADRQ